VEVRVFSGASGAATAPTKNFVPVTMVETRLDQGASIRQDLPADYNAVIVVLEGEGSIGAEAKFVTAGDVAWLTRGGVRHGYLRHLAAVIEPQPEVSK
jgi:redox-sensitive bicupin YhaK (pirin superfamily)